MSPPTWRSAADEAGVLQLSSDAFVPQLGAENLERAILQLRAALGRQTVLIFGKIRRCCS